MEVNLEFSWGHRRIAKSSWERPGRERAAGGGQPALETGRPPQSFRNGGLCAARVWTRSWRVRCQGKDRPTEAGATERSFSPPGWALFCSPAPNTSLGPPIRVPVPDTAWKRTTSCSRAAAGCRAAALLLRGLRRRCAQGAAGKLRPAWRKQVLESPSPAARLPALEHRVCMPSSWQDTSEAGERRGR